MKAFTAMFVYSFLLSFLRTSTTLDTITPSQSIRDGETLVSAGRIFELGFFSPGSSKSRYVGVWYVVSNDTVVWVANRETPLENHHGVLKVTNKGILVLLDSTNTTIWSSNTSRTAGNKINIPTTQLLDSGNLVVKDGNIESLLWQSFDHPCDTLLSEMKIGWDLVSGLDRYITSWKSTEDPAPSKISVRLDRRGFPQLVGFKPKSPKDWNSADWSGGCVRGTPLGCNDGDGFLTYKSVKLPDTSSSWFDRNMSLQKCEEMCLENCSCLAYANLDIRNGGSGCLLWFADLVDLVVLQMGGQDLYIHVAALVLDHTEKSRHFGQKNQVIIIICSAILLMVMLVLGLVSYAWTQWIEDKPMDLIDEFLILGNSCILSEVLRCIHVGLLCVQQKPEDRPNMSSVVLMLSNDNSLPNPRQPSFFTEKALLGEDYSSRNEITCTMLEARSPSDLLAPVLPPVRPSLKLAIVIKAHVVLVCCLLSGDRGVGRE
nr:s-locus-specific glycoprotein s13 [Quercus suber]